MKGLGIQQVFSLDFIKSNESDQFGTFKLKVYYINLCVVYLRDIYWIPNKRNTQFSVPRTSTRKAL